MCKGLGDTVEVKLFIDSAAALGISGRRGLGKVRHIEVGYLWLQSLVSDRRLKVQKIEGDENPADLSTKHFKAEDMNKHMFNLSCFVREGRTAAVPTIQA